MTMTQHNEYCDCQFRDHGCCHLVAMVSYLPLEQSAIQSDACRACGRTDTPQTGAVNSVIASIAIARICQHKPSRLRVILNQLAPYLRKADAAPESPTVLAGRYLTAVSRWIAAGRPVRSDDEVACIFTEYCEPCKFFRRKKDGVGKCSACGCKLKRNEEFAGLLGALHNKIRMATEHCWKEFW